MALYRPVIILLVFHKSKSMTYDEIRSQVQDGDLIFLRVDTQNLLSRLTSWFTKSRYTHVAFVFWYKERLMLVESTTKGGIRIVQASTYRKREIDMLPAPVPWHQIEDRALSRSGTADYGWFSASYIGIREFFFTHFDVLLPVDRRNRNKACSEFVAEVLQLPDVDISPGNLYRQISGIRA
jgi:hypothetical protein